MTILKNPQAIKQVCKHMQNQPDGNPSGFFVKDAYKIYAYGPVTMKGMKINTAPFGIENRVCEKVINIYNKCQNHNKASFNPILPEKNPCNNEREAKMQEVMSNQLPVNYIESYHLSSRLMNFQIVEFSN